MIDEVHMLSNHAFNAMLKSLEEPPDYLKFVLATTDPQKVPPTVLSRCLQFNLRPLAPQTVHEHLTDVLAQEGIDAAAPALQLIARAARGSMRDALSLTDQAIAHGAGAIDEAGVRQMLGAVDRSHAVRLVESLAARDGAAVIAAIDQLRDLGLSAAGTLEEMAALLQQMAVLQVVPEASRRRRSRCGRAGSAGDPARAGRDAAALQHRAAWTRRDRAGARRIQRSGDGAAAPARVSCRGHDNGEIDAGAGCCDCAARCCSDGPTGRGCSGGRDPRPLGVACPGFTE
jgi:hypothetical protein